MSVKSSSHKERSAPALKRLRRETNRLRQKLAQKQKQLEKTSRESEFYKKIFNSITFPFKLIDAEDYTVLLDNSSGDIKVDDRKRTCYSLLKQRNTPCSGPETPCPLKEIKETGQPVSVEHIQQDGTGAAKHVEVKAFPVFDDAGRVTGIMEFYFDVTECRQAEKSLLKSEEFNRGFIETSRDCIKILDLDQKIIFMNEGGRELMGLASLAAVKEMRYEDFWGNDRRAARQAIQTALAGGNAGFQGFLTTYRGEPKWWDVTVAPLYDNRGQVENLLVVSHDITKHKEAEEELVKYRDSLEEQIQKRTAELKAANLALESEVQERKIAEKKLKNSEIWLRSTFNTLDLAMIVATPERKLVSINEGARQMFGYSWEEIDDFTTEVLHVDRDHYLEFGRRIKEAFDQGLTARFEFEVKSKNGRIFPSEHFVSLLKDDQGAPIGILSVVRDISERKQTESNLQRSQASLARAQEIARLGNWDWDLTTNKLFWSDEIYRLLGRASEEFGDNFKDFLEAVHPEDRRRLRKAVAQAVNEGRKYHLEHRIIRPDGSLRTVRELGEVTFDQAGRAVHFLGTVQDITELKEAEDELNRYREHLEEMIRMRTTELEESNRQLLREINERKQAEEALKESERHLRTLMEQAPVGILTIDNSGRITDANPKSVELLGSPNRSSTVGINVLTLSPLVQAGLDHYFRLVLEKGQPQDIEALYKSIWGKQTFLRSRIVPRYDSQGVQIGAIQILEDITAAREAEEDLRKLYQAVEHSSSTVVITDPAGQIEYVNPKFTDSTGYSRKEALGQNPRILKSGAHSPEVYNELWGTLKGGGEWRGELLNRRKNGELFWEMASISAIRDEKGQITHFVAVKEDITDRKMAEKKLRRELAINSATTRLAETLISTDAPMADITNLVMEEAMKLTASRNGFVSEVEAETRLTVKHVYDHLSGRDCPVQTEKPVKSSQNEALPFSGLWSHGFHARQGFYTNTPASHPGWKGDLPPGHIPIERFVSVPATVSGELVGQINLANAEQNYTQEDLDAVQRLADLYALALQRFRTSEALREAKIAAETANRAKSEFLANMSHEIRTPMNAIMGMIDLTLNSGLNSEQKDNLVTAQTSSRHLLGIINNILDLSKIESGRVDLEVSDFNLISLLESTRRIFTGQAKEKNMNLNLEIAPEVPAILKGDPNRLRQIMVNLIGNAFKFTESGQIDIKIEPYVPAPGSDDQASAPGKTTLLFSVRDTGVGLEEGNRERIFESFRQAEAYTSRKYGGTGLGLAISRHLVEIMNGRIWVESQIGRGSRFAFTAVFDPGDPSLVPAEDYDGEQPPGRQQQIKILLAEDNPVNAKVAEKLLDRQGHATVRAANGLETLEILRRDGFDLVLMDVEMPEMDGFETARRIRLGETGENNREIPIVAMTAHALSEFREKAREVGMNDFITKPVDFSEFNSILRRYFKRASYKPVEADGPKTRTEGENLIDMQEALRRIGGDEELLRDLLGIMARDLRGKIEHVRQALIDNDLSALNKLAHSLRSSCGTVGAISCHKLAYEVEQAAKREETGRIHPLTSDFVSQLERLQNELDLLVGQ